MILPLRGEKVDRGRIREVCQPEPLQQRIEDLLGVGQVRLSSVFDEDNIQELCNELGLEYRERVFTPAVTLGLFVSQTLSRDDACSTVVMKFNRERKRQGLPPVSTDASAYCKARSRLPLEMINTLQQRLVDLLEQKTLFEWKWEGQNVYLVDGLVLRAPDTEANQAVYPQTSSQKPGLGFPQVRMIVVTSLATGAIVYYNTAAVAGKQTGEATLFRESHGKFKENSVFVGDSNLESFHDAALIKNCNSDLVFCINASRTEPFDGECILLDEEIVTLKKPRFEKSRFEKRDWEALPNFITYRIIRYRVSGRNEVVTVVTTLLDSDRYTAESIAELFGLRWDVEIDICSYKSTMGLGELRGQNPENLDREIAVGVLAHNLVRVVMNDSAEAIEVHPREISFSRGRDAWQNFGDELKTPHDLMWIILSTTSRLVRDRPGREEPRAIKRRQNKYPLLTKPRPSVQSRLDADDPP